MTRQARAFAVMVIGIIYIVMACWFPEAVTPWVGRGEALMTVVRDEWLTGYGRAAPF